MSGIWQNPMFQMGMGVLSRNQGITGDAAFRNALGGGMSGVLRGQTLVADIQRQKQQAELIKQQMAVAQAAQERQRQMTHMAPQLTAGLLSDDPDTRRQAMTGILSMSPGTLPQLATGMLSTKPTDPSNAMRIYTEAGGEAGTGKSFSDWYGTDYKGGGTTVEVKTGSIPSGFRREETPEGTRLVPEPGGPADVKRREGLIALEGVYSDILELESLVQQHGTEAFGETARRMKSLRNRIIGNLPAIRQTGVLQEGELKRIEQELPKGESVFTPGAMVLPLVKGFREEVERTLQSKRSLYGMPPAAPPPAPVEDQGWTIERVR